MNQAAATSAPGQPNLAKVMQLVENPPPELVSLAESVFVTMAMHQLKAEAVRAYSTEVLAQMQSRIAPKWTEMGIEDKVILDPKEAFLLSDEDAAKYFALCEEQRVLKKMSVDKPGNCPELEAENLFRVARNAFLDALSPYTGITLDKALQSATYDKLTEWGLKIMAKHVNPHKKFGIPQPGQPDPAKGETKTH